MFGVFGKDKDDKKKGADKAVTDAVASDPKTLEQDAGIAGRMLIRSLDTAMGWQTSVITAYVRQLRARHPEETPAQLQERIDDHFINLTTGTGGAAGGASVVPGIGFFTGLAAIAVESLFFLEAAAWHTLASARLRDIDIDEDERRRSLILVTILGSSGTAVVAATIGGESLRAKANRDVSAGLLSRLGLPQLGGLNKRLLSMAQKRVTKSARMALVGKLMPMGIGAVLGATANRKLAKGFVSNSRSSLGPLPRDFADSLTIDEQDIAKARETGEPEPPLSAADSARRVKEDAKAGAADIANDIKDEADADVRK
ncbi:hypothetical protein [Corynebacterium sp.]|uniref:hypothetical protein n=1 Tax=Corynebacterium sp. TaxID=1720 RepID=UPI0026DB842C|nr:hypothetical protein [Corynebacterium sp.]MDO4610315.1 hypothetical protein [Corynebacterium sp.]